MQRSAALYREAFGVEIHPGADNEAAGDRWLSGRHAAYSWYEGAYPHFALYQAKTNESTRLAQVGFSVLDIDGAMHTRWRRGRRFCIRRGQSHGGRPHATWITTATS